MRRAQKSIHKILAIMIFASLGFCNNAFAWNVATPSNYIEPDGNGSLNWQVPGVDELQDSSPSSQINTPIISEAEQERNSEESLEITPVQIQEQNQPTSAMPKSRLLMTTTPCTITFSSNGGSGSMKSISVSKGSSYILPECGFTAPLGKEFDYWDKGAPSEEITIEENTIIKAIWKEIRVENVNLNKNSLSLVIGKSETLRATVIPSNAANQNVTWTTDNPEIAVVNASGTVSAVAPGVATIKVQTKDGGYLASCKVTVQLNTPELKSASVVNGGVTVSWNASAGAAKYRVFRKTGSSSWARLGDTTALTYTDTTAVSGTTYTYTVRCITSDGSAYTSWVDEAGKKATYVATPVLKSASVVNGGVTVSWNASAGAAKYRVFRKTGSSSWARLGDTTALTYTDTTAVSGTTYTYTVRCITSDGSAYTSWVDEAGKKVTYVATPVLKSASVVNGGVTVSWNAAAGAVKYRVFRKTGSSSWARLGDTTALTYTDKTAVPGTTYTYTVRCITSDGSAYTSWVDEAGKKVTYVATPVLKSASVVNGGVTVSWNAAAGAVKYRVFRKTGSSSWARLGDTTALTYTDKTAVSGTTYTYTVRCITSDGSAYTSWVDEAGKKVTYVATPVLKSASVVNGGVTVSWNAAAGAVKYRVFRKTGSSSWARLGDTTALTYTDKTVVPGTTYTYTVRCITSDGSAYTSWVDEAGKKVTYNVASTKYTVTFSNNGGKGANIAKLNCDMAGSYQLPLPNAAKKGSYFKEWNTKADGSGTAYKAFVSVSGLGTAGSEVKLYAIWHNNSSTEKSLADSVASLVNQRRTEAGLSKLSYDADLSAIAMERAKECAHLFSHTRPNGAMYTDLVNKYGYVYTSIGENIAAGQTSAAQVMNDWMNSAGHKANILNSSYTAIGIGCCLYNGVYYWVQNFSRSGGTSVEPESGTPSTLAFAAGTKVQVSSSTPHFSVIGSVSTNYSMSKIIYEITTPALYRKMTYTWSGGGTSAVTLGEQINATLNAVAFNGMTDSQARGSYILKVTAEDTSGKTAVKTINWTY